MPSNSAVVAYTWEAQASRSLSLNNKLHNSQKNPNQKTVKQYLQQNTDKTIRS